MLTVSLRSIRIHAPIGLYPEEKITGNSFETDVDVWLPDTLPWPFADYTLIQQVVTNVFQQPAELLETVVYNIHASLQQALPMAQKIRVAVRKLNPPMPGNVDWSQVCYEAP